MAWKWRVSIKEHMAATLEINYQKSLALGWVCLSLQIQTQRDKTDQAFWLDHHRRPFYLSIGRERCCANDLLDVRILQMDPQY